MVDAIILAGGFGTRLASVLPHLPKALAPIQGTPFLDLVLSQLAQSKIVSQAILALGHRSKDIQTHYQDKKAPLPLCFSIESTPLGTGGAVLEALAYAKSDTLLILNGDCFNDLSYQELYHYHTSKQSDATLAVSYSSDLSRYGSVCFEESGRIVEFKEKSSDIKEGYLSRGVYLIQKEALLSFPLGACSIETDLFPSLLSQNAYAYPYEGMFLDIGTPNSYALAQEVLAPWLT